MKVDTLSCSTGFRHNVWLRQVLMYGKRRGREEARDGGRQRRGGKNGGEGRRKETHLSKSHPLSGMGSEGFCPSSYVGGLPRAASHWVETREAIIR